MNYGGLPEEYNVEDFIDGKRSSYVRNKLITRVFKDAGIIEEYSSGLARVVNSCKENSNKKPLFRVDRTSFSVEIESLDKDQLKKIGAEEQTRAKVIENIPEGDKKTTQKIIDLIKNNSEITRKELAEKIGNITEDGIKYHLNSLIKKGLLKRIGPDKGGYWEVLKKC